MRCSMEIFIKFFGSLCVAFINVASRFFQRIINVSEISTLKTWMIMNVCIGIINVASTSHRSLCSEQACLFLWQHYWIINVTNVFSTGGLNRKFISFCWHDESQLLYEWPLYCERRRFKNQETKLLRTKAWNLKLVLRELEKIIKVFQLSNIYLYVLHLFIKVQIRQTAVVLLFYPSPKFCFDYPDYHFYRLQWLFWDSVCSTTVISNNL